MARTFTSEAWRSARALLYLVLMLPVVVFYVATATLGRGALTERTAIEAGILLASAYPGIHLTTLFLKGLVFLIQREMKKQGISVPETTGDAQPPGLVVALVLLNWTWTLWSAAAFVIILRPSYGSTALTYFIDGLIPFSLWLCWLFYFPKGRAAEKLSQEEAIENRPAVVLRYLTA